MRKFTVLTRALRPSTTPWSLATAAVAALTTAGLLVPTTLSAASAAASADVAPPSATSAGAPAGSLTEARLVVDDDGTTPADLDGDAGNGLVATNVPIELTWSLAASDLVDGTFRQELPEGWTWDPTSLTKLTSDSSVYRASHEITDDGRTLEATVSIPNSSLVNVSGLRAVPGPTATGVYEPTLEYDDGAGSHAVSATPLTVVGRYTARLGLDAAYSGALAAEDRDLGAGPERVVPFKVVLTAGSDPTAPGAVRPMEVDLPLTARVTETTMPEPALVLPCSEGPLDVVGREGRATEVQLTEMPSDGTVAAGLCYYYRVADVPELLEDAVDVSFVLDHDAVTANGGAEVVVTGTHDLTGALSQRVTEGGTTVEHAASQSADIQVYDARNDRWVNRTASAPQVSPGAQIRTVGRVTAPKVTYSDGTPPHFVGMTDLVAYLAWDRAAAQLFVGDGTVTVTDRKGVAVPTDDYVVEYTADPEPAVDAGSWTAELDAAGGPAAVTAVRVRYTAGAWADGAPATSSDEERSATLEVTVRQTVVGAPPATHTAMMKWDSPTAPPQSNFFSLRVVELVPGLWMSADPSTVLSGNEVEYTVRPRISYALGRPLETPATPVEGIVLTLTFDAAATAVDYQRALAEGWTVLSYTPADYGPDGMPATQDDGRGVTVRLGLAPQLIPDGGTGDLAFPAFVVTARSSIQRPVRFKPAEAGNLILRAQLEATGAESVGVQKSAAVIQADTLTMDGGVSAPLVDVADADLVWRSNWYNFSKTDVSTGMTILNVLPYDGDPSGTATHGRTTLLSAELVGNADGTGVIEVTDTEPGLIGPTPGSGAVWRPLAEGDDLSTVTAVRVLLDALPVNQYGGLVLRTTTSGQRGGDVLADVATAQVSESSVRLSSAVSTVEVTSATVSGTVWDDQDRDGVRQDTEPPLSGAEVLLTRDGADLLTATTAADGSYVFRDLPAGAGYAVAVDPATLQGDVVPTADPGGPVDGASEPFDVPLGGAVTGMDFGYAVTYPAIGVSGSAHVPTDDLAAGEQVDFTYVLTNTGDMPLVEVSLQETLGDAGTWTWPGDAGLLEPGQEATVVYHHTLTQDEVDRGEVSTTGRAVGTSPTGREVSDEDTVTVAIEAGASLHLTETGALDGSARAGEPVTWTVEVRNDGATSLTDVTVTDDLGSFTATDATAPLTLAPGESATVVGTSVLSQHEVDHGLTASEATATGTTGTGTPVRSSTGAEVRFDATAEIDLELLLDGAAASPDPTVVDAGADITWTYRVTNNGDTTLSHLVVTDDAATGDQTERLAEIRGTLAPGEQAQVELTDTAAEGVHVREATVEALVGTEAAEPGRERAVRDDAEHAYQAEASDPGPGVVDPTDPEPEVTDPTVPEPEPEVTDPTGPEPEVVETDGPAPEVTDGTDGTAPEPTVEASTEVTTAAPEAVRESGPGTGLLATTGGTVLLASVVAILALAVGAALVRRRRTVSGAHPSDDELGEGSAEASVPRPGRHA